jgi:GNAT superfamily N-acetyltransferase
MPDITLLTPEDWRAWRTLRLRALAQNPEAFATTLAEWSGEGDTEERWRGRLMGVALHALAITDNTAVGMISATEPANGAVWLLSLWVDPVARGQGIGDILVQSVATWAREQGAARVMLGVWDGNASAIALYQRNGFADTGDPRLDGDVVERRMVLHLT